MQYSFFKLVASDCHKDTPHGQSAGLLLIQLSTKALPCGHVSFNSQHSDESQLAL